MKNNIIRYSLIVLLIGLAALAANQAYAQSDQIGQFPTETVRFSYGVTEGTSTKIKIYLCPSAPERQIGPVVARFQILDTEGEVIAQSGEIRVAPGQIRFWDVPRDRLPASREPGGRLEVSARIIVTSLTDKFDPAFILPSIEVIDSITGRTIFMAGKTFLIFVTGPNGRSTADQ